MTPVGRRVIPVPLLLVVSGDVHLYLSSGKWTTPVKVTPGLFVVGLISPSTSPLSRRRRGASPSSSPRGLSLVPISVPTDPLHDSHECPKVYFRSCLGSNTFSTQVSSPPLKSEVAFVIMRNPVLPPFILTQVYVYKSLLNISPPTEGKAFLGPPTTLTPHVPRPGTPSVRRHFGGDPRFYLHGIRKVFTG